MTSLLVLKVTETVGIHKWTCSLKWIRAYHKQADLSGNWFHLQEAPTMLLVLEEKEMARWVYEQSSRQATQIIKLIPQTKEDYDTHEHYIPIQTPLSLSLNLILFLTCVPDLCLDNLAIYFDAACCKLYPYGGLAL